MVVRRFKPYQPREPIRVDMDAIIGDHPPRGEPCYAQRHLQRYASDEALRAAMEGFYKAGKINRTTNRLGMTRYGFSDGSLVVVRPCMPALVVDMLDSASLRAYFDSLGGFALQEAHEIKALKMLFVDC